MPSLSTLHRGSGTAALELIPLRAGPLTLSFDPVMGAVRHARVGDHEVVRCIYGAVRDRLWNTVPTRISDVEVRTQNDAFRVTFSAECVGGDVDFAWHGTVEGDSKGTVTFKFEGQARRTFERNRIGLCVTHPLVECAGTACQIEHANGAIESGVFPRLVSAGELFRSIRSVRYAVTQGVEAEIRCEGDVFGMEDQRNWTDASFKTYSTDLDLPCPVRIESGTHVHQSVRISLPVHTRTVLPVLLGRPPQFSISTTPVLPKPPIGLRLASHATPLTELEISRLRALGLAHLRVDVRCMEADWADSLERSGAAARALGLPMHLALYPSPQVSSDLSEVSALVRRLGSRLTILMLLDATRETTPAEWVHLARSAFPETGLLVAAGSDYNFYELNLTRPPYPSGTLLCYPITPQVHASDELTLIENLSGQAATVDAVSQFAREAVVVSPVTLSPRPRPGPEAAPASRLTPPKANPRQTSLFAAGWTLGSLAKLATCTQLHSVSYYETTGPLGVMATDEGSTPIGEAPASPGRVFPVYHIFADLAGWERIYPTHSSHPLQTEALTLVDSKNQRRVLVANLTGQTLDVKIKTGTCEATIRYLDETNAEHAMSSPEAFRDRRGEPASCVAGKIELHLLPYAIARVDC